MERQRLIVGPFNRVEGDLEVRLDVAGDRVEAAWVTAPMYRGFENMLVGRDPLDALVIVPRICGICSVSQSVAAALALGQALGVQPTANGDLVTRLMLATENLADHLTHFYLFFMPDFARPIYASQPWFEAVSHRFAAHSGAGARAAVAARQRFFTVLGLLGGRWPHTHSIGPGGSSRAVTAAERLRLLATVREFTAFVEETLLGDRIESLLALQSQADLERWLQGPARHGDFALFAQAAHSLDLAGQGVSGAQLYTHGAWGGLWPSGTCATVSAPANAADLLPATVRSVAELAQGVTEDNHHAWYADGQHAPQAGLTQPRADKPGAYTWNKAPRWHGQVMETGAIARQVLSGQALVCDAVSRSGANVWTRVLARVVELARALPLMQEALQALQPGQPFQSGALPGFAPHAHGVGLTEAARGALGHWLTVEQGRISHYQIVAPTSWNFSPRDAAGTPGALEAALVGTPVRPGERTPVAVQHVVRSFDPCMVCTVH
ncbi:nickel-dependent hydrogenase large subunit [Amphibiibacter pelophylacis]|uniref:Nickel-dependent hydrogenase large subunit n=1 Tax=Amphibiibacter pelophylacis TaxID=1799477 RepID=A0ACC6P170_9BURK